jgi:hypothetical protein
MKFVRLHVMNIRGCIQKFPEWLPGARTANGTALCSCIAILWVSLVSFVAKNPLYCFSTNVYCGKGIFRYRLSPETYGYTVVFAKNTSGVRKFWMSHWRMRTWSDFNVTYKAAVLLHLHSGNSQSFNTAHCMYRMIQNTFMLFALSLCTMKG